VKAICVVPALHQRLPAPVFVDLVQNDEGLPRGYLAAQEGQACPGIVPVPVPGVSFVVGAKEPEGEGGLADLSRTTDEHRFVREVAPDRRRDGSGEEPGRHE
jgi:hypothetical protein